MSVEAILTEAQQSLWEQLNEWLDHPIGKLSHVVHPAVDIPEGLYRPIYNVKPITQVFLRIHMRGW